MTARTGKRSQRRRLRARSGAQGGFTLIEVLIAILLSVIAIVGISGLYRVQTKSSSFSRHTTEATALAEDRVEQMRTQQAICAAGADANIDSEGNPGGIYTRTYTVTAAPPFVCGAIQVSVTWNEEGNVETVNAWGEW